MSGSWKTRLLGERWPAAFQNSFHPLLQKLTEGEGVVLQILHNTRGSHIARAPGTLLKELLPEFEQSGFAPHQVAESVARLQGLDLVQRDNEERWKTTWMGSGVSNWRKQLEFSEEADGTIQMAVAGPREGENGDQPLPGCTEFRPVHFAPGSCWCRRPQSQHVDQVLMAATRLLQGGIDSTASRSRFPGDADH